MPRIIIASIISYLLGSIPTAYLFVKILKGVDIRSVGSGNVGATNAMRVLGKGLGITVLLLDILKGFIAVKFLGNIFLGYGVLVSEEALLIILGIAVICGHNWTIFLQFKGGKGIATSLGVLLALAVNFSALRAVLFLLFLTWVLVFLIFRIISLASLAAALGLPIYMSFYSRSRLLLSASMILSLFTIFRHKSNIKRLLQGKESRL
jgi:glycerol-3-phosphate acyltransferase PlsY